MCSLCPEETITLNGRAKKAFGCCHVEKWWITIETSFDELMADIGEWKTEEEIKIEESQTL